MINNVRWFLVGVCFMCLVCSIIIGNFWLGVLNIVAIIANLVPAIIENKEDI